MLSISAASIKGYLKQRREGACLAKSDPRPACERSYCYQSGTNRQGMNAPDVVQVRRTAPDKPPKASSRLSNLSILFRRKEGLAVIDEGHKNLSPSSVPLLSAELPAVKAQPPERWTRVILWPFLLSRLLLLLVGYATWIWVAPYFTGASYLPGHSDLFSVSWQMWRWFDSFWYLSIAEHGYAPVSAPHTATNWAFYPGYPLSIYLVGSFFGGTDLADTLAGLLISNGCALIALIFLYRLVKRDFCASVARRTVLFMIVAPPGFYLSAVYSESLWLALSISCLYYARQRRWWLSGFLGTLAAFTRPQGVGLLVPLIWEFWQNVSAREKPLLAEHRWQRVKAWFISRSQGTLLAARRTKNWLGLLGILLLPCGALAFFAYAWSQTGDFLTIAETDQWGWGRHLTLPWVTLWEAITHPIWPFSFTDWSAWSLSLTTIAIFMTLLWPMTRKLPGLYTAYAAIMLLFPLISGSIASIVRYYLVIFPVPLLLALWSVERRRGGWYWPLIVLCLIAECLGMASFVLGLPFIA